MENKETALQILQLAKVLDFSLCGISPASATPYAEEHRTWIAEGKHGEMHYLEQHLPLKLSPQAFVPFAKSIICVADAYPSQATERDTNLPLGYFARYGWGDDYHKVLKKRLQKLSDQIREIFPQAQTRCTTDTAPLLEREYASLAGLGWQGKNTLLIHPRHGSYMLLGAILTDLELPTSQDLDWPDRLQKPVDHCANCTKCIDACPTDAIGLNTRQLDARKCISYLTLEHKSDINPMLADKTEQWIGGCDICQEVCPYNKIAERNPLPTHPRYAAHERLPNGVPLLELLQWQENDRQQHLSGTSFMRMKLPQILRNAQNASRNWLQKNPHHTMHDTLKQALADSLNDT